MPFLEAVIIKCKVVFFPSISFWFTTSHEDNTVVFPMLWKKTRYLSILMSTSLTPTSPLLSLLPNWNQTIWLFLIANKHQPPSPLLSHYLSSLSVPIPPFPFSHKHKTILSYPALAWEKYKKNDKRPEKSPRNGVKVRVGQRSAKGRKRAGRKEGESESVKDREQEERKEKRKGREEAGVLD